MYISLIASVAAFFLWPALERWCAGKGAGKALDERRSEIRVQLKSTPGNREEAELWARMLVQFSDEYALVLRLWW